MASVAPEIDLRDQLSSLQGLLVLSMMMTESGDESHILRLAATSVPSLGPYRLHEVYVADTGRRGAEIAGQPPDARADIEAQLAVIGSAGGPVAIVGEGWGWAFPLRSLEGHFGHMVVGADSEPSPAGQFLLRVLAQQTGVALANSRAHARERAVAEELRTANAALAQTVAVLERSTAIHDRLTRAAAAGEGQAGIAQAVHELTGYPVAAEDRHGNPRAWAGPGRPEPYPKATPEARRRMLRQARLEGRPFREAGRVVAIAGPRDDVLGVLVLIDPEGTAGEQEMVALEHGATVLAMELARLQGIAEIELRLGRDLVEELLAGTNDEDSALERARALGHDLERPHRVLVVQGRRRPAADDALLHAVRRAARTIRAASLLSAHGGAVVVLTEADPPPPAAGRGPAGGPWEGLRGAVVAELRDGDCRMGVGGVCARPADFPRSHREARFALRMQHTSGGPGRATVFDDLGVYRILAGVQDTADIEAFAREWLGALIAYDDRRGSELVRTLGRHLECGRAYDATADALSIHRSTLKYRLRRISEISGHDLADPETRFNLQLATRAWGTLLGLRPDG